MDTIWFLSLMLLAILNVFCFYFYLNRILNSVNSFFSLSQIILFKLDKLIEVLEGLTKEDGVLDEISKKMTK